MKIKENFVLRNVADTWVVLPLAEATLDLNGMLTLNDSGVILWNSLEKGCDKEALVKALTDEYDVADDVASADVDEFLQILRNAGCIEE